MGSIVKAVAATIAAALATWAVTAFGIDIPEDGLAWLESVIAAVIVAVVTGVSTWLARYRDAAGRPVDLSELLRQRPDAGRPPSDQPSDGGYGTIEVAIGLLVLVILVIVLVRLL